MALNPRQMYKVARTAKDEGVGGAVKKVGKEVAKQYVKKAVLTAIAPYVWTILGVIVAIVAIVVLVIIIIIAVLAYQCKEHNILAGSGQAIAFFTGNDAFAVCKYLKY